MGDIHTWVRAQPWLSRFTLMNRILLAMAFIPTGMVKVMGRRFTEIPIENPIGFFFEGMYRSGPFWHFIGGVQVLAAVLLLIPRTAVLGALLFAPIAISILLITIGLDFGGTVFITSGMMLSVTYLICWDADRIWAAAGSLLQRAHGPGLLERMHWVEASGWGIGAATGIAMFLVTRSFLPNAIVPTLLIVGTVAVLLVAAGWIVGAISPRRTEHRIPES